MIRLRLVFAVFFAAAAAAWAQVPERWRLDFRMIEPQPKPTTWLYQTPLGEYERYWYFTYEIQNNGSSIVPLHPSIVLYIEYGRDMQHDVMRTDPDRTARFLENPEAAERLLFGRYYHDMFLPRAPLTDENPGPVEDVEFRLLTHMLRLRHLSPGAARESIRLHKQRGMWLNSTELRARRVLRPGERYTAFALFRGVDPRAQRIEIQVAGLEDPLRVSFDPQGNPVYSYVSRILRTSYRFPGDEFERERDIVIFQRREWVEHVIGPIAHKETLRRMVNALVEEYRRAERRQALADPANVPPEAASLLAPGDIAAIVRILETATLQSFPYDGTRSVLENEDAIRRIHEWWLSNERYLRFDPAVNRYVLDREPLPGTTRPARP